MELERFSVQLTLEELSELSEFSNAVEVKYYEVLNNCEDAIIHGILNSIDEHTFKILSEYLDVRECNTVEFFDKLSEAVADKERAIFRKKRE